MEFSADSNGNWALQILFLLCFASIFHWKHIIPLCHGPFAFPAHLEANGGRHSASGLLQVFHGLARVGKYSRKSLQGRPGSSECYWATSHNHRELMNVLCDVQQVGRGWPGSWHLRPELVEPSSLSDAAWLQRSRRDLGHSTGPGFLDPVLPGRHREEPAGCEREPRVLSASPSPSLYLSPLLPFLESSSEILS